ncbi:MAG: nitroreductase family protein [Candidatus Avelusimicrobium sp.]|uniref:nitroreductase family protein n=1 Tax=Candidatus Avelusimicrobium sp. TaxID=3048833 RepID=UPI003F0C8033
MELIDAINTRRSVRKYQDKPVEREKINACIEAARLAPSACNSQPWHFIVIDDPKVKEAFCKEAFSGVYNMTKWAEKAPVLIAAVSDKGSFTSRIGNFFRRTEFYLVDQGIACEHLVLRAWDLGLGTCWIGWLNSDKAEKFFKLPKGKKIEHLISLGYPAEEPNARPRQTFENIVSYNEYK